MVVQMVFHLAADRRIEVDGYANIVDIGIRRYLDVFFPHGMTIDGDRNMGLSPAVSNARLPCHNTRCRESPLARAALEGWARDK